MMELYVHKDLHVTTVVTPTPTGTAYSLWRAAPSLVGQLVRFAR